MEPIEIIRVCIAGAILIGVISKYVKRIRYNRSEGLQMSFRTERRIEIPAITEIRQAKEDYSKALEILKGLEKKS